MKLSIIIPIFNEIKTLPHVIEAVLSSAVPMEKEIILVDDGSTDGSGDFIKNLSSEYKKIFLSRNSGKGAALRAGLSASSGDIVLVQDADLEYSPNDYEDVIKPIINGDADVVFGSRFITAHPRRVLYFHHYLANKIITFISNLFTGLNLSDMETGTKVFNRKAVNLIKNKLVSDRFGIEPEITARVSRAQLRIYEVGISYKGRTYSEGKKIKWHDGLAAIWHIIRFNLISR